MLQNTSDTAGAAGAASQVPETLRPDLRPEMLRRARGRESRIREAERKKGFLFRVGVRQFDGPKLDNRLRD